MFCLKIQIKLCRSLQRVHLANVLFFLLFLLDGDIFTEVVYNRGRYENTAVYR